jgi:preprotein translocase subunit SecE
MVSTVMVMVMAILASLFFLLVDTVLSFGIQFLLGLGGS